jgi:hypothetical protein
MPKSLPKPEPVIVKTVCSLCDEPWEAHGDNPTTLDCIRLLKMRPRTVVQCQGINPWPVTIADIPPYVPYFGAQTVTIDNLDGLTAINTTSAVVPKVEYRTPEVV